MKTITVLLLAVTAAAAADNASRPDLCGTWVSNIASDTGTVSSQHQVVLDVTRSGYRLNVTEMIRDGEHAQLVRRQYSLQPDKHGHTKGIGTAVVSGQDAVLRLSHSSELWKVSDDGWELIVKRWGFKASPHVATVLVLRRAGAIQ